MQTPKQRLTPDQLTTYREEGYLIYRDPVLPVEKFDSLKKYFDRILANLSVESRPELMDMPHYLYPELYRWIFDDEVLDLVEPIIGSDIALFATAFLCKPKGNGKRVPWHEDSAYWKEKLNPMEVVTIWLAIDPSTRENGCMEVIPHSHREGKKGFSDYDAVDPEKNVFPTEITKNQIQTTRAIPLELQANQASLHDARLIHGSEPNHSTMRRCGFTMRFISTKVKFNADRGHQIFLARGRDLSGNTYGDSSRDYADLARFRLKHGKTGH